MGSGRFSSAGYRCGAVVEVTRGLRHSLIFWFKDAASSCETDASPWSAGCRAFRIAEVGKCAAGKDFQSDRRVPAGKVHVVF